MTLEMDEGAAHLEADALLGQKYVYPAPVMHELREFFAERVAELLPAAQVLYFT